MYDVLVYCTRRVCTAVAVILDVHVPFIVIYIWPFIAPFVQPASQRMQYMLIVRRAVCDG